jgi:hypothetical protein
MRLEKWMLPSRQKIEYLEQLARAINVPDYEAWLARVRQEEAAERAEPNTTLAAGHGADNASHVVRERTGIRQAPRRIVAPQGGSRAGNSKRFGKNARNAAEVSLSAQLFRVCDVWEEILEDRRRDGIFRFLKAVYRLVTRCQREGRAKELLHSALKIAGLPANENAELFSTVIRATCDGKLDPKSVSKLSRALRYAAYRERPPRMLIEFIKGLGGINAAADRYAKRLGRGRKAK